ncbi:MAG: aminomethyl-transferring glycine dehydrogenase subunit GcvPA [Planctomycetota bacterium]|nr:aminomethyl-transferring glycine dehydrogenase subunit GcvPA [Planctomycetota bacterium]
MGYIPHTEQERTEMLAAAGAKSLDDLFAHLPKETKCGPLPVPHGLGEMELSAEMRKLAAKNRSAVELACFLGAGAYDHFIPPVVGELISRGELYTAYTPYQPEISQGVLQLIYEYQTMIASLAGCDVANASLYDGGTAMVEAVQMAMRHTGRMKGVILDGALHPYYLDTVRTGIGALGVEPSVVAPKGCVSDLAALAAKAKAAGEELTCVAVGYPNFFGSIEDLGKLAEDVHAAGGLLVAVGTPWPFGLIKPPGHMGVDIVCGEGQALGVPMQYGGPYVGYIASDKALVRRMPGRLVGKTVDVQGRTCYTLTLQAREQHIRREKATSNICTNTALCAMMAHFYMSCLGQNGLKRAGELAVSKADLLRGKLKALSQTSGSAIKSVPEYAVFHEFVVETKKPAAEVLEKLLAKGILGGLDLGRFDAARKNQMLVCVTEKRSLEEIDAYVAAVATA